MSAQNLTERFDVRGAAKRLGVSEKTIYRLVERQEITHRVVGRNRIRFDREHIAEYEQKQLRPAKAA